jgi:RNA polymerase sigma-70 factor (family 1)
LARFTGIQDPLFLLSFHKGEEQAFDCLFREYFPSLTYYANRFLHSRDSAEDIVQDCFVLLWQKRDQLQQVLLIKSYLFTTVRNQCFKFLQKKKKEAVDIFAEDVPDAAATLITAETASELYRLISKLTPSLQQVIRLYYLEGKSNHEIAKLLDIQPDTVIRQRLRAILTLRKAKISL